MGKEVISDFLVRIGFDGKEVIKGVAKVEASLARLKKANQQGEGFKLKTAKEIATIKKASQKREAAANLKERTQEMLSSSKVATAKAKAAAKERAKRAKERRAEIAHQARLTRSRNSVLRSNPMNLAGMLTDDQSSSIKRRLASATSVEQIKDIRAEMGRMVKHNKDITKQMARQFTLSNAMKFSMSGIVTSLKNLARSWVSVFAIIGAGMAGLKWTQQFRSMEASFLAVSDSTESAAANMEYIKDLSTSLPVDVQKAGDNFKNMLASGRESLGEEGVKELFTSITEYGTALQVDPEKMNRGMQAISQMLNKGQVMAEELKQQWEYDQAA